ncbi:hypothetical protein FRC12_018137 [Ceratobasidium sp. 428]|nr:hypothetical protein FRC12_018137 [Ceratobasidium sp. 428]
MLVALQRRSYLNKLANQDEISQQLSEFDRQLAYHSGQLEESTLDLDPSGIEAGGSVRVPRCANFVVWKLESNNSLPSPFCFDALTAVSILGIQRA